MTYPDGQTPRLTTTALYEQYQEYCRLFNVPVPAEKGQVGRYLNEKFGISSAGTTEENVRIRYYPGLWLSKTARLAYAELSLNYSNYSKTTDKLQKKEGKNDIINLFTTATTEEWPKEVIEEIERMFSYIQSCQNPQDISYESYVKNAVVSVVAVVGEQQIANPESSSVVLPSFSCSYEAESVAKEETKTINVQLQAAEELTRRKEVHDREQAAKHTKKLIPATPLVYHVVILSGRDMAPILRRSVALVVLSWQWSEQRSRLVLTVSPYSGCGRIWRQEAIDHQEKSTCLECCNISDISRTDRSGGCLKALQNQTQSR